MKHVAILGFGKEGRTVFRFLKKSVFYKRASIEVRDKKFGSDYLRGLVDFDIIFRSPGIPYTLQEIQIAKKTGKKISSATELFFENCPCPIIGITGTKGKSTTATLVYKILSAEGKDAHLAGNIGKPALSVLPSLHKNSIVVLELSSFQLQELKHSPHIAVILDIFPDHLDAHKNLKEYIVAKTNIIKWQKKSDVVFYDDSNRYARAMAKESRGKKIPISPYASNLSAAPRTELRSGTGELENRIRKLIKIPGRHQLRNALMAAAVASYLGISERIILKTITNFRGLPHRLELVRIHRLTQNKHGQIMTKKMGQLKSVSSPRTSVSWYNDSASTNPHTAAAAIQSFKEPVILIAGGKDKNLDYKPLAKALRHSNVVNVILYGENRNKIAKTISGSSKYKIVYVKNLKSAVGVAYQKAKVLITSYQLPITVLLSPASASFDQFHDYKHRGDEFKKIVRKLKAA